jgi:hypothetical protein
MCQFVSAIGKYLDIEKKMKDKGIKEKLNKLDELDNLKYSFGSFKDSFEESKSKREQEQTQEITE